MGTLLKEAIGTVAMPQVEVLPRCATGCCSLFDRLPVDKHLDRPYIAREIVGIRVGFGQGRWGNAGIIINGVSHLQTKIRNVTDLTGCEFSVAQTLLASA